MATAKKAKKVIKKTTRKAAKKSAKKAEVPEEMPGDGVMKLTEIEALRFGKLDAEIRNSKMGVQLVEHQIRDLNQQIVSLQNQINREKLRLRKELQPTYNDFILSLSQKYGIEPNRMILDPEIGTIREQEQKKSTST